MIDGEGWDGGAQNVLLFNQIIWMFNTNNQGEDGVLLVYALWIKREDGFISSLTATNVRGFVLAFSPLDGEAPRCRGSPQKATVKESGVMLFN